MTYFEVYLSLNSVKALRGYTRPLDISGLDHLEYAWSEAGAGELYRILYRRKTIPIISKRAEAQLQKADKWAFDSCTLGVNLDWAFHPDRAG